MCAPAVSRDDLARAAAASLRLVLVLAVCWVASADPPDPAGMPEIELQAAAEEALRAGQLDRAYGLYGELVRRFGEGHRDGLSRVVHERLVADARFAMERGELDEAAGLYRKALVERASVVAERELFAVELRVEARRLTEALEVKARELAQRADEHLVAERYAEAVADLERATQCAADPSALRERLVAAQLRLLQVNEAREAEAALQRGRAATQEERWADAVTAFNIAAAGGQLELADQRLLLSARFQLNRSTMVLIPAGRVWLGNEGGDEDELPPYPVELGAFYIDRTEVTNRQYFEFVAATGYPPPADWTDARPSADEIDFPVSGVSWRDAQRFAQWCGKRLPTEAEWIRAARGDSRHRYPWGEFAEAGRCNSSDEPNRGPVSVDDTYPEGASSLGVRHLLGNVLEWTDSAYGPFPGATWRASGPRRYVLCGGSWHFPLAEMRVGRRIADEPTQRVKGYGFRCALSP